jgi:hypothetical protein
MKCYDGNVDLNFALSIPLFYDTKCSEQLANIVLISLLLT